MGGGPVAEKEYILIVTPFQGTGETVDWIRRRHPNSEFKTISQQLLPNARAVGPTVIPDEEWKKVTVLVTLRYLPPDPKLVPNLKFVHFFSAGTDHITNTPIYKDSDITLTTSSGIHGPQIAEWVILQLLAFNHHEKELLAFQREHKWGKQSGTGTMRDYVGQRLGVLGYGSIGRQTARVAKALGLDVIAYTASPRKTPESKKDTGYIVPGTGDVDGTIPSEWYSGVDKASLHNFLSQDIDVLLVSVPLTDQTRHFLGKEEFKILGKKNAFIANIARGSILVQDDLIAALKQKEGGLRGAALDVTDPEPLNPESELWDLPNVAITPHNSGSGSNYVERSFQVLDRNLTNLEQGHPLINVVNRRRGY